MGGGILGTREERGALYRIIGNGIARIFFFSKRYNNNLYSSQLDNFIFISVVNQSREGRRNFIEQVRSPIIINN